MKRTKTIIAVMLLCHAMLLVSTNLFAKGDIDMSLVWIRLADEKAIIDDDDGAEPVGQDWHIISCEAAEFSPDGTKIISGSKYDGNMRQWDVATGNMLWDKAGDGKPKPEIEAVGYTKDGVYGLFVGEDYRVYVRRVSDGVSVRELQVAIQLGMDGMRVSNDGKLLATAGEGGGKTGEDAVIYIWDISNTDPQKWVLIETVVHGNYDADVNQVDWSPDDSHLISSGHCGLVKRWDTSTWKLVMTYTGFGIPNTCENSIKACRISPDLKYIAGAGKNELGDGQVTVWDYATGAKVAEFWNPQASQYEAVEFTKDSKHLFVGGLHGKHTGGGTHIFNDGRGYINIFRSSDFDLTVTPDPIKSFYSFRQEYLHLNFDDSKLVSSHEDGTLRLWDVKRTERTQIAQESFNEDGEGVRYTRTKNVNWDIYTDAPNTNPQATELFGYQITGFFAADNLENSTHNVTLNPVDATGKGAVKVAILLAAAEGKFESDDYLDIQVDLNNTGAFQNIAHFTGTGSSDLTLDGAGVLKISRVFQEFEFDVPPGGTDLVVRVRAKTNENDEEFGFDNIRVSVSLKAPTN